MDFSKRSYEKELLDSDNLAFADLQRNLQELEFINKYLGGHHITLKGLRVLTATKKVISVCEVGCGGGDNLKAIEAWCTNKGIKAELTGIDINKDCIVYAKENCNKLKDAEFITSDYKSVVFHYKKPDIIFSSLFCHHLNNNQLIELMNWSKRYSAIGFFINDLDRNPLAYYSIKLLTKLFSRSYLVKNDAPLSVKRSFKRNDWIKLLVQAGLKNYSIQWKWAFRWLVIVKNEEIK
jgi:2-polyprenyl-3-methyl-5-hydroxy-6-metoxy-1,4-benzoquinol methylase